MDLNNADGTFIGGVAAAVIAFLATIYRFASKLRRDNQVDGTDIQTLKALDAAVLHWRTLYDAAWKQVLKEREQREAAEARASKAMSEIEQLRGEVAALRREVEHLTDSLRDHGGLQAGAAPA